VNAPHARELRNGVSTPLGNDVAMVRAMAHFNLRNHSEIALEAGSADTRHQQAVSESTDTKVTKGGATTVTVAEC
jgi:hypothetical protein